MSSVRQDKVSALIKREMAVIFQQLGNEFFKGSLITVTQARISPDLGVAKLYVSVFPPAKRGEVMESILQHTSVLRGNLGDRVGKQLRKIPELTFFLDDSLDYSDEIDKLLKG